MDLKDKVAFITGGASGLGRATAENFINAGAKVMVFDLNEENAQKAAEELGENAAYAAGDVADEDAVTAAVQKTVDTFGALHTNINSAGIGAAARTLGKDGPMALKQFEFIIRVNLIGTFNCLRLPSVRLHPRSMAAVRRHRTRVRYRVDPKCHRRRAYARDHRPSGLPQVYRR